MIKHIFESRQKLEMGIYLRVLSLVYLYGAVVHFANLLGFGELSWREMPLSWKLGDIFYGVLDPITAVGLWLKTTWGIAGFLLAAMSQIILYLGFPAWFVFTPEHQQTLWSLVIFHLISLGIFFSLSCSAFKLG
ncbi:MAG: hypothetical protein AAFO04_21650 [Cyanobacteria bacterium J06592_8]